MTLKELINNKKKLARSWAKDGLLTVRQTKDIFSVEDSTIRTWYNEGKLRAIKLGESPQSPVRVTLGSILKRLDLLRHI